MLKSIHLFHGLVACLLLSGCMGNNNNQRMANPGPAPVATRDVIRPGDKLTIRLTGVPGDGAYLVEVQVPSSGEVTVPLITQPFQALGKPTYDLAAEIKQAYITHRIYSTPDVSVLPEERYVNVGGDVRSPTRVPYAPDLTLMGAINSCGGFTDYAKKNSIRILRGQQVIYVDGRQAASTPGADPVLLPGDQIMVPRTIF